MDLCKNCKLNTNSNSKSILIPFSNHGNTVYKHRGCIRMDFGDANLFFVLPMDITIFIQGPIVVYFIHDCFQKYCAQFYKTKNAY